LGVGWNADSAAHRMLRIRPFRALGVARFRPFFGVLASPMRCIASARSPKK